MLKGKRLTEGIGPPDKKADDHYFIFMNATLVVLRVCEERVGVGV